MNRTIVVLSHNRPIQDATRECLGALTRAGAAYLTHYGTADVALARCYALSEACNALRMFNEQVAGITPRDTILMVDDDMLFSIDQAQALVDRSRETGVAASAMYATTMATVAAARIAGTDRWLTGLGLLAIPAGALLELERDSESFAVKDKRYTQFTWSKVDRGAWFSEDFTLCQRLGGVYLLPIAVGHLKVLPIYPDDETIAAIRENRPIVGDANPEQLKHITQSKAGKS